MIGDTAQNTHVINESKGSDKRESGNDQECNKEGNKKTCETEHLIEQSNERSDGDTNQGNGDNDREIRDINENVRENETNICDQVDNGQLLIVIILFYGNFDYIILFIVQ